MAKTNSNSNRNTSHTGRGRMTIPKAGFTRTRREYGEGGRTK